MIQESTFLKIEKYLAGTLTQQEIVLFEEQMKQDKELADEVKLSIQLNLHFNNDFLEDKNLTSDYASQLRTFIDSDAADKIKRQLSNAKKEYAIPAKPVISSKKRFPLWAAASIVALLICTAGFFLLQSNNTQNLYAAHYSEKDIPSVIQRSDSNTALIKGVEAFKKEDYLTAINSFNEVKEKSTALYIYKGMAYLENNQFTNSIKEFDGLIDSQLLDASKGFWFKALAYLKNEDIENAKNILKIIADNPSYFKHNDAKALLDKL